MVLGCSMTVWSEVGRCGVVRSSAVVWSGAE